MKAHYHLDFKFLLLARNERVWESHREFEHKHEGDLFRSSIQSLFDPEFLCSKLDDLNQIQRLTMRSHTVAYIIQISSFLVSLILTSRISRVFCDDALYADVVGKTVPQILKLRNFDSEEHSVESGKFKLQVFRILNPKISKPNKTPVLFVHGFNSDGRTYIINSADAKPQDYSDLNAGQMSLKELRSKFGSDPTSKSLALLLSNFGHDVWVLNRRPVSIAAPKSSSDDFDLVKRSKAANSLNDLHKLVAEKLETRLKPISNSRKWDFSFDEQALKDLPRVIDYILENTGHDKLSLVGHSAGSATILMMLSELPEYAAKTSNTALFAPALNLGNDPMKCHVLMVSARTEPIFRAYTGPIDERIFGTIQTAFQSGLCQMGILENKTCDNFDMGGESNGQNLNLAVPLNSIHSSHEQAQLFQSVLSHRMHKFDFHDQRKNFAAYGNSQAPMYDTNIISADKLSVWQGNTDAFVSTADSQILLENIKVPVEYHLLDKPGLYFNHAAFIIHKDVAKLLNLPVLQFLESKNLRTKRIFRN